MEGVDNRITESDNNQVPSEMGAIEEHADQRPQVTEAIEEQTASTIDDESEMNEMDERTQNIDNSNKDISDEVEGNNNETTEEFDQTIDHKEGSSEDEMITIEDINIMSQMNSSQMAMEEEEQQQQLTHSYKLRECPTERKQQVLLLVAKDEITGVTDEGLYKTIHPKVHSHMMLSQMNINDRLLAFGEKGNEAILKEL